MSSQDMNKAYFTFLVYMNLSCVRIYTMCI